MGDPRRRRRNARRGSSSPCGGTGTCEAPLRKVPCALDDVLAMEGLARDDRLRALEAAGGLAWWAGDMQAASSHYLEALHLSREVGSDEALANALYNAGMAMSFKSPGDGTDLLTEGLGIAERSGNTQAASQCRWGLSSVYQFEHDFERARQELIVALAGFRSTGDVFMTNWTLRDLGSVEMVLNRLEEVRRPPLIRTSFLLFDRRSVWNPGPAARPRPPLRYARRRRPRVEVDRCSRRTRTQDRPQLGPVRARGARVSTTRLSSMTRTPPSDRKG